jgi:hypothetical protein
MRHLTPSALLDVVEESEIGGAERAHFDSCPLCRERAGELAATLADACRIEMPEPSPLFWERLSDRVRQAIAADPPMRRLAPPWAQWPAFVPFAALAVLVVALVSAVAPGTGVEDAVVTTLAAENAADPAWALLSELIGPLDVETAREAGIGPGPGAVDDALLELSAAEQEELVRLLRQELRQPGG